MRTEYKRDMNHNYLILYGDKNIDTASYQVRMLTGNIIPSILKCRIQGLNGEMLFYYDITSKQSMASLYEQKKFGLEDLQLVFGGFIKIMDQMTEYLLNPVQLILTPSHIYLDLEKKQVFFCCLPGNQKEIQDQFRELTEYILPKLDHEDEKAVVLGYGIYRKALEERFHLEAMKEMVFQVRKNMPPLETVSEKEAEFPLPHRDMEIWKEEKIFSKDPEIRVPRKKETLGKTQGQKQNWLLWFGGCGLGALTILGLLFASMYGFLPWLPAEAVILCGIAALGLGLAIVYVIEKKQKRNLRVEEWRERIQKELQEDEKNLFKEPEEIIKDNVQQDIPAGSHTENPLYAKEEISDEVFGETVLLSSGTVNGPASLVSREPGELATIYLDKDLMVIGKLLNAADAVISLPTISRVHARIRKQGEDYFLTDLNSRNGTSVNGRMLRGDEEYCLQEEDEVDFAQARYIFLK